MLGTITVAPVQLNDLEKKPEWERNLFKEFYATSGDFQEVLAEKIQETSIAERVAVSYERDKQVSRQSNLICELQINKSSFDRESNWTNWPSALVAITIIGMTVADYFDIWNWRVKVQGFVRLIDFENQEIIFRDNLGIEVSMAAGFNSEKQVMEEMKNRIQNNFASKAIESIKKGFKKDPVLLARAKALSETTFLPQIAKPSRPGPSTTFSDQSALRDQTEIVKSLKKAEDGLYSERSEKSETLKTITKAGKYYALIIGNNNYKHLPQLQTAKNDAQEIEKVLSQKYGFETKLLLDATRNGISRALNKHIKILGENDNFLIYYAGHGIYDETGKKAYWLPVDALRDDDTEWIIIDDITTKIRRVASRHVLVVADSCFSGTMTRGISINVGSNRYLDKMVKKPSRTLIASGGNEPVSDSGGKGHSVFAEALIQGLAEMDRDVFTAEQLYYAHIKEQVAGNAEQTPEYSVIRNSGHNGGDFVFRRVD